MAFKRVIQYLNSARNAVSVGVDNPLPIEIKTPIEENGGVPVNLQDQTTPTIILPLIQLLGTTAITADAVIGEYTIAVASASGFVVGQHFRIIDVANDRYYYATILGISGLNITLDTQFDFAYVSGAEATISNKNMNVDGSTTPIIFKLRTGTPSIPSVVDITRLIFICTATSAIDLIKFGNLTALTNGLTFRRRNGDINNSFNVKTNADIASLMYDWTPYVATNPSQGLDGFVSRLTFAGQNKMGVALRVEADGNLEVLIQDDLRALTSLNIIAEGHIVQDNT